MSYRDIDAAFDAENLHGYVPPAVRSRWDKHLMDVYTAGREFWDTHRADLADLEEFQQECLARVEAGNRWPRCDEESDEFLSGFIDARDMV